MSTLMVAMLLLVQQPINRVQEERPKQGNPAEEPRQAERPVKPVVWGEDARVDFRLWADPEIWDTDVVVGLGNSASEAAHLGFRYTIFGTDSHEQSAEMRITRSLGSLALLQLIELPLAGVVGYSGNARVYRNWGFDSIKLYELPRLAEKDASVGSLVSEIWDMLIHDKEVAISGARDEWMNDFWTDPERSAHFETLRVQAEAGHNNMNMAASRAYRRKILGGYGHPMDLSSLVAHQISATTEVFGGDENIADYVVDIANDGVHTTEGRIKGLSWGAFLLSNSVISSVVKQWDYWGTGRTQTEIMEWEVADNLWIGAPEFYLWLTTDGPAPMLELPIRYQDHSFSAAVQYGYEKDGVEIGVGWNAVYGQHWTSEVSLTHNPSNRGYWIEVGPSYSLETTIGTPLRIGFLIYYGAGMTYTREQDTGQEPVELERQEAGVKFFAEYNLRF